MPIVTEPSPVSLCFRPDQKQQQQQQQKTKEWRNPFLPYEEDLWVSHLSPSHTLLLNKFNVVPYHLLVVTREFQSQQDPLKAADFDATLMVGGLFFQGFRCKRLELTRLPGPNGQA